MDTLTIEGMEFEAKHGYYAVEKEEGGKYLVDVIIEADLSKAGKSDELEDTINYEIVYKLAKEVMEESKNLIEHVAYELLEKLIKKIKSMSTIRVRVVKLNPPLDGSVKQTSVSLYRDLNDDLEYWAARARY